jgi:hypothetical protein
MQRLRTPEIYLHSPVLLHVVVFNEAGTTLPVPFALLIMLIPFYFSVFFESNKITFSKN